MTGENNVPDEKGAVEDKPPKAESPDDDSRDGIDLTADDDDILDGSTAEIKVDELVAKIESEDADEAARKREVRQKLDALNDQRDDEFGSTYNFNIDEDL